VRRLDTGLTGFSPSAGRRSRDPVRTAVLFDLDGTLFDHQHAVEEALRACTGQFAVLQGQPVADLASVYTKALTQAYDLYLAGSVSVDDVTHHKIALFDEGLAANGAIVQEVVRFVALYEDAYLRNRRTVPTCAAALGRILDAGILCAVVTNGETSVQRAKLESIGLGDLPMQLVTSERAGAAKPDPLIFVTALQELGVDPPAALMVGDSLDADVKGALSVGMPAVLYNPIAPREEVIDVADHPVRVIRRRPDQPGRAPSGHPPSGSGTLGTVASPAPRRSGQRPRARARRLRSGSRGARG
jgi:putative hydrolase of the HAD superfamily